MSPKGVVKAAKPSMGGWSLGRHDFLALARSVDVPRCNTPAILRMIGSSTWPDFTAFSCAREMPARWASSEAARFKPRWALPSMSSKLSSSGMGMGKECSSGKGEWEMGNGRWAKNEEGEPKTEDGGRRGGMQETENRRRKAED